MSMQNQWHAMRSFTRDPSVTKQRLKPGTVRRITGYARPYRLDLAIFLVAAALDAVVTVLYPVLIGVVIDKGILPKDSAVVLTVAGIVAGLAIFDGILGVVQRYFTSRVGEGLIYDLRTQVFGHVQRQPIAFFTRAQTGSLVSRLNNDVIGAQQALTSTLSSVVSSVLQLVLVLAVMFVYSWQVTVVALVLIPIFLYPARRVGRRLQRLTRESMQLDAQMGSTMTERFNVAGAMLAKLYGTAGGRARPVLRPGRPGPGHRRADGPVGERPGDRPRAARDVVDFGRLRARRRAGHPRHAAARRHGGARHPADAPVRADHLVVERSSERDDGAGQLRPGIRGPRPEAADRRAPRRDGPGARPPGRRPGGICQLDSNGAPEIEFDQVSFRYPAAAEVSLASLESIALPVAEKTGPGQEALTDVSFHAPAGKLTALVGPSGAGKTTITHLVSRMYDPVSGVIRIGGTDIRDVTLESLHDVVGVVTQDAHMYHDTIRANLLYARPAASEHELILACQAAQIWDLVSELPDGLDTIVGDRGYRLSGGEKQRIALARLLLKAPSVVVLDEATAHLDSESEAAVQRALKTALAGRTSLVIAHRLSTIREADQILVIDGGRVIERGQHADLLAADGLYADLYRTQFAPQETGVPAPVHDVSSV